MGQSSAVRLNRSVIILIGLFLILLINNVHMCYYLTASYYLLGIIGFGIGRSRPLAACVLFPLDFTAAGGLGQTSSLVRLIYAAYLEVAVTIASVAVAILRVSATQSLTNIGLKYGLLIEV